MTQKEEVRDLALVVDDVIVRLKSMSVKELKEQKELWEERICNDEIESPCQAPRLRVLRAIIKELNSRGFYWRFY